MSDVRHTTRHSPATSAVPGSVPSAEGIGPLGQREGWRVDPPHVLAGSEIVQPPTEPLATEFDVVQEPFTAPQPRFDLRTDDPLGDPLLQARQIAEHLQLRYADLQRRETRLSTQLSELDLERRSLRMWVAESEATLQEREERIQQRDEICANREVACLELEHEMQGRKAALLEQERDLADIQTRWREEWERERQVLKQELDQQRLQLENDQAHFELVKEGQLADIQQERALLLNRSRFQEEHLQKLRREFESAQAAFHHEKQQFQSDRNTQETQLELRQSQLSRFREVLDEREAAIQRYHNLVSKTRLAELDGLAQDRQRLEDEQREWQLIQERQRAELERRASILQLNAENLEGRQSRLEQLRVELEETNRKTMEMRVAVEEACAQLAQAVGPDLARQRIESAQFALAEHYRQAREAIGRQRQELEQFEQSVLRQRNEFRAEQQTLADWIARRDAELQQRENRYRELELADQAREQTWQRAREHWLREKLEAEIVIRDLLQRLEPQA